MASSGTLLKTPLPRSARRRRVPESMTLREFEAFDTEQDENWELVEGVPYMAPSARAPHNNLARLLCAYIESILTIADGWYSVVDTSARFPERQSQVRPDVATYKQADLKDPNRIPIRAVPALLVECLSPSNASFDLNEKKELCYKVAVAEYWVVDPNTGAISLFVRKKQGYEQLAVDELGFIASPLLKRSIRIIVKQWEFEIVEA